MVKSIIYLPDGTEIGSDMPGHAIKSSSFVRCVNSGEEFTIGSVCANKCEFVIFDVGATLNVNAGDEITVYRDDGVTRKKMGIFILEKPSRPTANTLKLVGYDRVIKLDKDLTEWMARLEDNDFAPEMAERVCEQCGLTFDKTNLSGFGTRVAPPIRKTGVTGRQIMQWIGEMYGAFCRANAEGVIEFAWYTDSGVTIRPTGNRYYLGNGLKYEGYSTDAIDGVKIRLSENENGALWPSTPSANPYIITGNAFLNSIGAQFTVNQYLTEVLAQISHIQYTPCTLSIPACIDIDAGQTIRVIDKNGRELTVYVMTKRTTGQKDVIECTGSKNRTSSVNKDTGVYVVSTTERYSLSTSPEENDGEWSTEMPAWTPGRYLWRDTKILYSDGSTRYSGEYYDSTWGGLESVNNSLHDYAEVVTKQIEGLQSQIDGQIQTWFYDYLPTNTNHPASEWTTTDLKNQHLGDLFYVVDNETNGGEVYRWSLVNEVYKWQRVEDTEVAKALELASQAKDIADGKRRVFVEQPYPPYDVGDLWAQGANGDLMRCKTARATGSYNASDWEKASKYIDETKAGEIAQGKVDGQTQMDIFNKLTNNGTSQGMFIDQATGDIYINATYITSGILNANLIRAGILQSSDGSTFYLDLKNGVLRGRFSELSIGGKSVDNIAQSYANTAESNASNYANAVANRAETNSKSYANTAAAAAVSGQTQLDIFNKLTNNGNAQGIYLSGGKLYVNAEYIKSGTLDANVVKVINLIADHVASTKGDSTLELNGARLRMQTKNYGETFAVENYEDGTTYLYFTQYDANGNDIGRGQLGANRMQIGGTWADPLFGVFAYPDGSVKMQLPDSPALKPSWKPNGDGTYTLIGR